MLALGSCLAKVAKLVAQRGFGEPPNYKGSAMNMKVFLTGATALALLAPMSAYAASITLPPPYAGSFTWNNDGTVGAGYTDVIQQDKDWGSFSGVLPSNSLVTPTVQFSHSTVGSEDFHGITFDDPLFAIPGTYTWSYDITITDPNKFRFLSASADIVQTDGTAELTKVFLDNVGDTYTIDFTKTGANGYVGNTTVNFDTSDFMLRVTDTLTVPAGSTVTAVENSFVQVAIPEPSTWAMMLLGFAGLGFVGYRKADRMSSPAA